MSDTSYNIWCLIEGEKSPFLVIAHSDAFIGELKDRIKAKKENALRRVDASSLELWKVNVDFDGIMSAIRAGKYQFETKPEPQLWDVDKVSDFWPQPPSDDQLHIYISLPADVVSPTAVERPHKKRKLDHDASEYKNINTSPSVFAKPVNFRKAMEEDGLGREVYIHNRPIDFESVPLALISPIFGRLSDDLFSREKDLRSEDFAPARNLANMLSKLEKAEAPRNKAFLDWLLKTLPGIERKESPKHALLQPHEEVRPRLSTVVVKGERRDNSHDYETDGHVELGDNLLLVTEGKPELGEESTNPHWQLMSYTRAYYMQKRCSYRVGQSYLPAILIAYYGPCIDASGAIICPDGSVQVEALTPALRVDCDFRDDHQRNLLARFVRALRNAFENLKEFYMSPSGPIPDPHGYRSHEDAESIDRCFPYKNSYTDKEGTECGFKYKLRLRQGALIFLAERTEPEVNANPIVVKFTRTYSKVAHHLLAGKGFAPELLAVEDLVGGWKVVVMEYLSGWVMLHEKPCEERQKYKDKLEEALRVIHGRNLVHGDVRGPNILVSEDGNVKLIDFDNCGVDGEDVYPREWDHTFRPQDAKEGDVMRKYHDDWMFDHTFSAV